MPDVLAIHWERRRLHVLEVSIGGTLRATQGFVIDVPESPMTGWLRNGLQKHNVTAKQALVCVPREDAILRQLELPDAPDEDLPLLVHFQASTRSATPLDQLLLDYVPLPRRSGSASKDVLMASVPRTTVDPIRTALTEAGLELVSLSLSSFALAELVAHSEVARRLAEEQRSLIIQIDTSRLEVVLLGQRQLLSSHVVRPPLDEQGRPLMAKAAADISRVLVPAQPWLENGRLDRIWLLGGGDEGAVLADALRERWHCSVERFDPQLAIKLTGFDPAKLSEPPVRFTQALGLALAHLERQTPAFDLLHPRQPKPRRDPRKLQMAVGSAAALLVLALGTAAVQLTLSSYDSSIAEAKGEESQLAAQIKSGQPVLDAAKTIEDWTARDINQLKLMADLDGVMQGTERLYVSDYNFGPATGDALAKLSATGNARERADSQQVIQRLVDARTFRVRPRETTQSSRDPDYPSRFELDADLVPRPKTTPGKAEAGSTDTKTNATNSK